MKEKGRGRVLVIEREGGLIKFGPSRGKVGLLETVFIRGREGEFN